MQFCFSKAAGNAAKGVLIGIANTIPGVSGGTIAVVTGMYDEAIAAIAAVFGGPFGPHRDRFRHAVIFLLPVVAGLGVGLVGFARVIDYFFTNHREATGFFFLGLIAGSVPFLIKRALRRPTGAGIAGQPTVARAMPSERPEKTWAIADSAPVAVLRVGLFAVTFALLLLMTLTQPPVASPALTTLTMATAGPVFLAGVISAATMIVPGISGSFVLLLIGMYTTFIHAAKTPVPAILIVFVLGAAVGIVAVAKLIGFVLGRYQQTSYWAITGLVLGSLPGVWPGFAGGSGAILSIAVLFIGFAVAYILSAERKIRHRETHETHETRETHEAHTPPPLD